MTGTVSLSPLVASDHVSARSVVVTITNASGTTVLPAIDATVNPAQFTCSDGDSCSIVDTDTNAAGSTASDPFVIVAHLPLQAPTKPSVTGVTFA